MPHPIKVYQKYKKVKKRLFRAQDEKCYICGSYMIDPEKTDNHLLVATFDHCFPRKLTKAKRFDYTKMFGAMACGDCNNQKADRLPHPCELLYTQAILEIIDKPMEIGISCSDIRKATK